MILMVDFVKEENHTERIQVLHGVYFMRGRENNRAVRYINDAHQVHGRVGATHGRVSQPCNVL